MPIFRKLRAEELIAARSLTTDERHVIRDDSIRFNTNVALMIAILIGVGACLVHCLQHDGPVWWYWSAVGTASTAFSAALGTGGVLGFLFGVPGPQKGTVNNVTNAGTGTVALATGKDSINAGGDIDRAAKFNPNPQQHAEEAKLPAGAAIDPSSLASPIAAHHVPRPLTNDVPPAPDSQAAIPRASVTQSSAPSSPSSSISNLEQVADWVTKLLLGGGLTQMQRIPPKIWSWARMVALGILGPGGGNESAIVAQQAFAAGLLVYGFIVGFFAGFLITKLQLGKAIAADPVS